MESKSKKHYRSYCEETDVVPLFAMPWYLDITCGVDWEVAESISTKGKILGYIPYFLRKRILGCKTMGQAPLTPFTYFIDADKESHETMSQNINGHTKFTKAIKNFNSAIYGRLHFDPSISNGIPLYQNGYDISLRYTFELPEIKNHDEIWGGFNSNVRNHINKNQSEMTLIESDEIDIFIDLIEEVYKRQQENTPFSTAMLRKLDKALQEREKRKLLFVMDMKGNVLSGVYLIFDYDQCYCLLTGTKSGARNLHPLSILYWEAIKVASISVDRFNFLGSMVPNIERMFRSFNGIQTPYISAIKAPFFIKLAKGL